MNGNGSVGNNNNNNNDNINSHSSGGSHDSNKHAPETSATLRSYGNDNCSDDGIVFLRVQQADDQELEQDGEQLCGILHGHGNAAQVSQYQQIQDTAENSTNGSSDPGHQQQQHHHGQIPGLPSNLPMNMSAMMHSYPLTIPVPDMNHNAHLNINIASLGSYIPNNTEEDMDLLTLVQSYEWNATLSRIYTHPSEAASVGEQGRTPLHVACEHDAPAFVIEALLKANPPALMMVGTSTMNPLHITCSSQYASVEVVKVLLDGIEERLKMTEMKDVDGDTSLHAACRCGAPIEVLEELLRSNPRVVHDRDYEGLTPLLRLWVRYFVMLGDDLIEGVSSRDDVKDELAEAWRKTELLLRAAYYGTIDYVDECKCGLNDSKTKVKIQNVDTKVGDSDSMIKSSVTKAKDDIKADACLHANQQDSGLPLQHEGESLNNRPFNVLHAASLVDCPRAVVKIASVLYPQQLNAYDSTLRTPLMIATITPIFKEHDLSGEGYSIEELIHGDDEIDAAQSFQDDYTEQKQPTVIQILLEVGANANKGNTKFKRGRLPLHSAIISGKRWNEGLKFLRNAYPDSLMKIDAKTGLYPFMLAAATGVAALKEEITTEGRLADLTTIFQILRSRPDQCEISCRL